MAKGKQPNSSGPRPTATETREAQAADNENQRIFEGADNDAREWAGARENDDQDFAPPPVAAERHTQSFDEQPAFFADREPPVTESDSTSEFETAVAEIAGAAAESSGKLASEAAAAVAQTQEEMHDTVRETLARSGAQSEKTFALFEQMSKTFRTAFEDAGSDAARISFKLMEFAQANLQNNVKLAKDYAEIKSPPEIFNAHATYFKRQIELLNKQAEELRALTTEIASKKAAQLQGRTNAK